MVQEITMKIIDKVTIGALLFASVMSTTACESKQKHEEKFCASLSALGTDLNKLMSVGPTSTVSEVRSITKNVDKHSSAVAKQSRKIGTPSGRQLAMAAERLSKETRDIPSDMTISQVKTRIADDVRTVEQSAKTLASESGCPGAMPQVEMKKGEQGG